MVRAHQAVLDRDLARDQVDQAAVDEMRADAARALFVEDDRFLLDAGKAADARPNRDAGAVALLLGHVGEAGIFERLAGGIDAVDDERIDLALDLVVDALVRIEAIFMLGRLHLAGDLAGIIGGIETGDPGRAALRRDDVLPARLDVGAEGGDKPETGDNYAAHSETPVIFRQKRPPGLGRGAALKLRLDHHRAGAVAMGLSPCSPRYSRWRP